MCNYKKHWRVFKLATLTQIRQTTKINSLPNFLAIQYVAVCLLPASKAHAYILKPSSSHSNPMSQWYFKLKDWRQSLSVSTLERLTFSISGLLMEFVVQAVNFHLSYSQLAALEVVLQCSPYQLFLNTTTL